MDEGQCMTVVAAECFFFLSSFLYILRHVFSHLVQVSLIPDCSAALSQPTDDFTESFVDHLTPNLVPYPQNDLARASIWYLSTQASLHTSTLQQAP